MVSCSFNRKFTKRFSISFYYVVIGVFLGVWVGRAPEIKKSHNLSDLMYGAMLLCAVMGSLLSLPVITPIVNRFGSQNTAMAGTLVSIICIPVLGVKQGGLVTLIVGITLFGFCLGMMDVSSNSQAVLFEKYFGTPSLGFFYAMYSFGNVAGAMIAGMMAANDIPPLTNFVSVSIFLVPMMILTYFGLFDKNYEQDINQEVDIHSQMLDIDDRRPVMASHDKADLQHYGYSLSPEKSVESLGKLSGKGTPGTSRLSNESQGIEYRGVPEDLKVLINYDESVDETNSEITQLSPYTSRGWQLFLLWGIVFVSAMGEGSICDWSTIFFTDSLQTSSFVASVGFSVFSLMMGFSRMSSDYLIQILGGPTVLRIAGVVGSGGLFLAVLSTFLNPVVGYAMIGMFLGGAGVGLAAPIVTSIGGRLPGRNPTQTIAALTSGSYLGFLVGPPLFGGLSQLLNSLQWALCVDASAMVLITFLALFLDDHLGDTFLNMKSDVDKHGIPVSLSNVLNGNAALDENANHTADPRLGEDAVLPNQLRSSLLRESHLRSHIM